jgi:hypothetical protein
MEVTFLLLRGKPTEDKSDIEWGEELEAHKEIQINSLMTKVALQLAQAHT